MALCEPDRSRRGAEGGECPRYHRGHRCECGWRGRRPGTVQNCAALETSSTVHRPQAVGSSRRKRCSPGPEMRRDHLGRRRFAGRERGGQWSPPGRAAETDSAEPGRAAGSADRQRMIARSLGRHVGGRSGPERFARETGQAEVCDAHVARAVQHHVGGLEVAMHDTALVRRGQPRADLAGDLDPPLLVEAADPSQQRREVLASTYSIDRKV